MTKQRSHTPSPKPSKDLTVFITRTPGLCSNAKRSCYKGNFLTLEDGKPVCLECADLDYLVFLRVATQRSPGAPASTQSSGPWWNGVVPENGMSARVCLLRKPQSRARRRSAPRCARAGDAPGYGARSVARNWIATMLRSSRAGCLLRIRVARRRKPKPSQITRARNTAAEVGRSAAAKEFDETGAAPCRGRSHSSRAHRL